MSNDKSKKQLLVRVTATDCRWNFYNGTGNGGQNRNKTANCVRVHHDPSGAYGNCQEERSLEQNKKKAFVRMANTKEFQKWLKIESSRASGELARIEEEVSRQLLNNTIVETKNEKGKWEENKELKLNHYDIDNLRNERDNE